MYGMCVMVGKVGGGLEVLGDDCQMKELDLIMEYLDLIESSHVWLISTWRPR